MKVDTSLWSEKAQDDFIEGWEDAGGYMGDLDSPAPFCCPWFYDPVIDVSGRTAKDMGRSYWRSMKFEVEDVLRRQTEEEDYVNTYWKV